MKPEVSDVIAWMKIQIDKDGCLYQDDVVDYLVRRNQEEMLRENSDGNLVVGTAVLTAFLNETKEAVVWVKPECYWRFRVPEDEAGREARG